MNPIPFSLRQLQYAVALAETLSFHRAAKLCHVSQPSLSVQLSDLETALGVRLFERDRRRVLLTSAGAVLIDRIRRVLRDAEDLQKAASQLKDPLAGTLRIGVIPTISPYLLPSIAPALRVQFPRLSLVWVENKTEVLVKELDEGKLDGALLALEAEIGDVEHEVIAEDAFVLVTPPHHPLGKSKAPATLHELAGNAVLLLDDGHCFREQALAYCTDAKARELAFRATSLPTLTQMVASGAGVTLLPELALSTEAHRSALGIRRFTKPVPHRTIVMIWRKQSALRQALQQITATIRKAYPTSPINPRRSPKPKARES